MVQFQWRIGDKLDNLIMVVMVASVSCSVDLNFELITLLLNCRDGEIVDAGTETNTNLYHELYYHFLGTDQSEDILCWRDPENPKFLFGGSVTDDGKVLSFLSLLNYYLTISEYFYVHTE